MGICTKRDKSLDVTFYNGIGESFLGKYVGAVGKLERIHIMSGNEGSGKGRNKMRF
jgi:hypothetical protein